MTISPARRAAFEILQRVEQENAYSSVLLAALDEEMRSEDRGLCHELVLGVLRRRLWLDRVIEHLADRETEDLDLAVKSALRLGIYQLRFLSRIPPSAAVNESVNLVRAGGVQSAAGMVNAVLRRATREPDYDPAAGVTDADEKLAIETSHPRWLIRRWANAFGLEETASLARANNEPAPVAFRLTTRALALADDFDRVIKQLESSGAQLSPSQIVPNSWRVKGGGSLLRELSRDGLIYLQDEASQLVAHLLGAQPNERMLDVCAAPGSKTMHTDALAPLALIVAGDLHEHRLSTLKALALQQGVEGIQPVVYDATQPLPFAAESFDRVLVDAPCSGTGTLRHNPEIRWRITAADIKELSEKQTKILANAAVVVRPGGRLVYSTCSVEIEENEDVAENFLEEHYDFASSVLDAPSEMQSRTGAIRTWPHRQDVDGFFIQAFERKS
jgi:16S rRNA (cytosine967-C5)-methyltransferase